MPSSTHHKEDRTVSVLPSTRLQLSILRRTSSSRNRPSSLPHLAEPRTSPTLLTHPSRGTSSRTSSLTRIITVRAQRPTDALLPPRLSLRLPTMTRTAVILPASCHRRTNSVLRPRVLPSFPLPPHHRTTSTLDRQTRSTTTTA